MEIFNVNWRRYDDEKRYLIGYLIHDKNWFFKYNNVSIKEAIKKGFRPFPELSNISKTYSSEELFKTFSSRLGSNSDQIDVLKTSDSSLLTDNILILHKKGKQQWKE